jgi:release factor glutamine methyltransferase
VAQQNAARHDVQKRIQFVPGGDFAALPAGSRFDLVISNPPYIPSAEIASLPPEVRDHDPRGALDGGPDGLECFRLLARQAGAFLKPGGRLMLEFGDDQADAVRKIFETQNWIVEAVREDYSQRPRVLIGLPAH